MIRTPVKQAAQGFTLVELMAVLVIFLGLLVLFFPAVEAALKQVGTIQTNVRAWEIARGFTRYMDDLSEEQQQSDEPMESKMSWWVNKLRGYKVDEKCWYIKPRPRNHQFDHNRCDYRYAGGTPRDYYYGDSAGTYYFYSIVPLGGRGTVCIKGDGAVYYE